MKALYDRLKPEFRTELDYLADSLGNFRSIKQTLRDKSFPTDISVGDAMDLIKITHGRTFKDFTNMFDFESQD
jgi:hypothetical protein